MRPKGSCPVCQKTMVGGCCSWHFMCLNCGYEKANLQSTINNELSHKFINEDSREAGLLKLRLSNFKKLLTEIKALKPKGGNLLEVGCAHGWFLDLAKNDFKVFGLEPDETIYNYSANKGLPITLGYFPTALNNNDKFDVIIFNDVFEHIPDIGMILKSCYKHLNEDGLLVLNLPSSDGIFYKLSKVLHHVGVVGFFERLWQKTLPSPHLHYFNASNLIALLSRNEFKPILKNSLSTLNLNGLYTRISYTGNRNVVVNFSLTIIIGLCLPILALLPSDIIYVVSRRKK